MKKRLLSVTAILVLCLALLSVTALAEDTEDYGVTVNGVAVTYANADDVLSGSDSGKVSYDANTNTLTINGTLSGPTVIQGNGATDVVINGVDNSSAANGLTVNGAKDVTVTANSGGSAINGATDITCSGDVNITNNAGAAVGGSLTVRSAQNVTVTANGSLAISNGANINCSGNVEITNNAGSAVSGRLTVNGAKDVTVTANGGYGIRAIDSDTAITCSGNVTITNQGDGDAVAASLTVLSAQNVTVTANSYNAAISTKATIACTGNVEITNGGNGYAVRDLTVTGAQNVTVTANSSRMAISGNTSTNVGANITCSGDVSITNSGTGSAVNGTLTVLSAQDVKVTANSDGSAINGATDITCSGNVEITNSAGAAVGGTLTVNDAQNVKVTANSDSPAIINDVRITCSGNVEITNEGSGYVVLGLLNVNGARNVTVTANGSKAIFGNNNGVGANITCSGDVEITNSAGMAVGGSLTVLSAQNVTVTANIISSCAINNGADITCSGNVEIVNEGGSNASAVQGSLTVNRAQDVKVTAKSGQAVSQKLTVKDAQNVTVTANSTSAATINDVDITCSGNVEIVNEGGGKAVAFTLTFKQSNGHSYTVKTGSLESLDVYAEKEAGETFEVESLDASAVKIESTGHTPGEWEYNSTQHWRFCTVCEAELDRADHSGSICTVCGYTKPVYVPTYPPIVNQPEEGGSVTVSPKSPRKGVTVTITPTPDAGYTVEQILVTDKNGDAVEVINNGDGTYSFTQPAGKVNINVTFMEDNSMLNFFVDVFPGDYYYDAVLWAAENGITGGVDDIHFAPNAPCTRAQIVTFLWRAAGCPEPESLTSLSDVPADAYYAKAVAWALENGITTGTGDGTTFSPNATCTRAQAMAFIWRSQKSAAADGANPFNDVAADAYYADAVLWAAESGVTSGTTATTFSPNATCTRAQIVTFLYRCLGEE